MKSSSSEQTNENATKGSEYEGGGERGCIPFAASILSFDELCNSFESWARGRERRCIVKKQIVISLSNIDDLPVKPALSTLGLYDSPKNMQQGLRHLKYPITFSEVVCCGCSGLTKKQLTPHALQGTIRKQQCLPSTFENPQISVLIASKEASNRFEDLGGNGFTL